MSFGAVTFSGDLGQFADALTAWLELRVFPQTQVFVEAPIVARRTRMATTLKLVGAQALVARVAWRCGATVTSVTPSQWRRHFIGATRAPKQIVAPPQRRRWLKAAALRRCAELGLSVASDDAADALGLLSFAMQKRGLSLAGSVGARPAVGRRIGGDLCRGWDTAVVGRRRGLCGASLL